MAVLQQVFCSRDVYVGGSEAGHVAKPVPLRDKLWGDLEELRRTAAFVRHHRLVDDEEGRRIMRLVNVTGSSS